MLTAIQKHNVVRKRVVVDVKKATNGKGLSVEVKNILVRIHPKGNKQRNARSLRVRDSRSNKGWIKTDKSIDDKVAMEGTEHTLKLGGKEVKVEGKLDLARGMIYTKLDNPIYNPKERKSLLFI